MTTKSQLTKSELIEARIAELWIKIEAVKSMKSDLGTNRAKAETVQTFVRTCDKFIDSTRKHIDWLEAERKRILTNQH